jgi:hypothetical protein
MPLYPTIAISDAFQSLSHFYAASLIYQINFPAALGLASVGVAGSVGTLRFSLDEKRFETQNNALADIAGFAGLPLVGLYFMSIYLEMAKEANVLALFFTLLFIETATRGGKKENKELMVGIINATLFIAPTLYHAITTSNTYLGLSVGIFVLGGVVITPARNKLFMGVICENWFHYCIGTSAVMLATAIKNEN